jgi:RNA polymerase sigma-70 factor (ECF subfamily)
MFIRLPGRKPGKKSDAELIKEFVLSGDLEILGTLYSEYMHLVYGVCLKYLKGREESMDAVMQIFEKLITEVPKQEIHNFRSWLHVVTRNFCLMKLRSQKSEDEKMQNWIADTRIFMESGHDLHPIDEENPEMDKALQDCIDRLKDEQKECIMMFYFENRSYIEIAGDLGLDEKKVKSHLQNGKRNLKICLEERNGKK